MYGLRRAQRAARKLRNRFVSTAVILVYHRVTAVASDPQLLGVTPNHFAEHLRVLRRRYRPLRLQHLGQAVRDRKIPEQAVVVTFDDGYADNLYNGKPLLEQFDVPGTVFVTTGYLGERREFWWDELDRILLQEGVLPSTLRLDIKGKTFQWNLGSDARYSKEKQQLHRGWNVLRKSDLGHRQRLYRALCTKLRPLTKGERRKVLDELRKWADLDAQGRTTHRALSPDEVPQLVENQIVEVGAHTVSHPVLSTLPLDTQRSEIEESKQDLEDILGSSVESFAYPYGTRSEYTADAAALVQEAGFTCACSNFADTVWRGSDSFQLPRMLVRDWDGDEFEAKLREWFGG